MEKIRISIVQSGKDKLRIDSDSRIDLVSIKGINFVNKIYSNTDFSFEVYYVGITFEEIKDQIVFSLNSTYKELDSELVWQKEEN